MSFNSLKYKRLISKAKNEIKNENYKQAIEYFLEAFRFKIFSNDYLDYGMCLLYSGEMNKAEQLFKSFIFDYPSNPLGYIFYGIFFEYFENYDEAIIQYQKAMKIDDTIFKAHYDLARMYDYKQTTAKDEEESNKYLELTIKEYERALELNECDFVCNLDLGSIYETLGDYEKALKYSLRARDINKDERMISYNLGVIYANMNDFDKAIEYYEEELSKSDIFPYTYYNLSLLYKDYKKDYVKAKSMLKEALKLLPKDYKVWYNLGCLHVLMNDFSEAYQCFKASTILNIETLNGIVNDDEIESFLDTKEYKLLVSEFKNN